MNQQIDHIISELNALREVINDSIEKKMIVMNIAQNKVMS